MVKIRLRRTGSKKRASFRIVVAPSFAPRDGRFLEVLGIYNPRQDPPAIEVKEDRVFHWLSEGAQMTDSMKRVLEQSGTLARYAQSKTAAPVETPAA